MSLLGASMGSKAAASGVAVSDNFNRANGGLGANWTTITGDSAPAIASNVVSGGGGARWSANTFADNQYSEMAPAWNGNVPGQTDEGAVCRCASGAATYYVAVAQTSDNGTDFDYSIILYKYISGAQTNLGSAALGTGGGGNSGTLIRLECSGASIKVYTLATHGGSKTQQISVTDSAITSGSVGIKMLIDGQLDNWYGGDL